MRLSPDYCIFTASKNEQWPHFSDLQDDLAEIQNNEERARYCCQRLLCRTLAGNNVYILTVTSPGTQARSAHALNDK